MLRSQQLIVTFSQQRSQCIALVEANKVICPRFTIGCWAKLELTTFGLWVLQVSTRPHSCCSFVLFPRFFPDNSYFKDLGECATVPTFCSRLISFPLFLSFSLSFFFLFFVSFLLHFSITLPSFHFLFPSAFAIPRPPLASPLGIAFTCYWNLVTNYSKPV